ncbi:hypothetical protein [Pararhizobium mangrovi]|nr:hypothetical protein [Pararhizobium mangrovi]
MSERLIKSARDERAKAVAIAEKSMRTAVVQAAAISSLGLVTLLVLLATR